MMNYREYDNMNLKRMPYSVFARTKLAKSNMAILSADGKSVLAESADLRTVSEWATGKNGGWFGKDANGNYYAVGHENEGMNVYRLAPQIKKIDELDGFTWRARYIMKAGDDDSFGVLTVIDEFTDNAKDFPVFLSLEFSNDDYAYFVVDGGEKYFFGDYDVVTE